MPHGALEEFSSSSSDSDADPFADPPTQKDFIILSPLAVSLSEDEEDVSPSQYRKEVARKETADQSLDEEAEHRDEEHEVEEEEDEESESV